MDSGCNSQMGGMHMEGFMGPVKIYAQIYLQAPAE